VSEQQVPATAELVERAITGDAAAWRALVDRYAAVVWSVARAHGLPEPDAADVSQAVWLNLAQQLPRLREPARLAGWLATVARRESLRVARSRHREVELSDVECDDVDPVTAVVRQDADRALWLALHRLPERCRALLRLIATTPDLTYAQAAHALGIRPSSVGRTRGRCLAVLRRRLECDGLIEQVAR
jgi:RNA polymerase sigma factor (sigma-70 family)